MPAAICVSAFVLLLLFRCISSLSLPLPLPFVPLRRDEAQPLITIFVFTNFIVLDNGGAECGGMRWRDCGCAGKFAPAVSGGSGYGGLFGMDGPRRAVFLEGRVRGCGVMTVM
ncbi:hypothetical protein C8R45DRAFT_196822 [Mycena sanguinolenta]|nr:hypothetical protein C8R45DRAFT_196822 [Mycena sanguinolenta]